MLGGDEDEHINLKIGGLAILVILLFGYVFYSNSESNKIEHDENNIEIQDIQTKFQEQQNKFQTSINDQLTKQARDMQNKLTEQQQLQQDELLNYQQKQMDALKANSDSDTVLVNRVDKNQQIQELLQKQVLEQSGLINSQRDQQAQFQEKLANYFTLITSNSDRLNTHIKESGMQDIRVNKDLQNLKEQQSQQSQFQSQQAEIHSKLAEQFKLIQNQIQTPSNTGGLSTDSTTINESYESPIPFTAITPFETTPRIPRTYGIADFDKIPIDCKNKAIMNTIFQNGATGMGYAYTCHNGGPVGPEVTYITPAKPRTENGSRNFANHNIDCGTNKVLTGWNMVLNSDNTTQIRYKCAPNLRKTPYTSRQVSTAWNSDAGGDPIFLDRQHIICSGDEALSRVQLEVNPTDNKQRYNLTCVK